VGNRSQVTDGSGVVTAYSYDPLNQLTSATRAAKTTSYAYDAVGNRTNLTAPGTSINYSYDAADRLLSAAAMNFTYDANGNQITKNASGTTLTYNYDAGNRVGQSVGAGSYTYVNDVASALPVVLQESGPDGNISYAYGLGLVSESGPGFDFFYHYDGLGSVIGLTDVAGRLNGRYTYDT